MVEILVAKPTCVMMIPESSGNPEAAEAAAEKQDQVQDSEAAPEDQGTIETEAGGQDPPEESRRPPRPSPEPPITHHRSSGTKDAPGGRLWNRGGLPIFRPGD